MKQEIYNPTFLFFSRLLSFILFPYYSIINLFRYKNSFHKKLIKTILVTEYHRIGDVIMIIPALRELKLHFKNARIILLCSSITTPLARNLNLVNEVIAFDAPWTTWSFSLLKWINVFDTAVSLRKRKIDLAIDFKGDIRNSWFIWQIKSNHSIGFTSAGGGYFFSKNFPFPFELHQTKRALDLISKIGGKPSILKWKTCLIKKHGYVVLHSGSSDERRSWPLNNWIKLINYLIPYYELAIVKTNDSNDLISMIKTHRLPIYVFEGNIIKFKNWLQNQRLLIAPDSMAGHLATHLLIPVISIFGSQNPELTKPLAENVVIIKPVIKCTHTKRHWRLCSLCIQSIDPFLVYKSTVDLLGKRKK